VPAQQLQIKTDIKMKCMCRDDAPFMWRHKTIKYGSAPTLQNPHIQSQTKCAAHHYGRYTTTKTCVLDCRSPLMGRFTNSPAAHSWGAPHFDHWYETNFESTCSRCLRRKAPQKNKTILLIHDNRVLIIIRAFMF